MSLHLGEAIVKNKMSPFAQVLMDTSTPLFSVLFETWKFTDDLFLSKAFGRKDTHQGLAIVNAGHKDAAKLLMTPTRDATVSGPLLREAHRRVGFYLATEFLGAVIGLEEYMIPHVQGKTAQGHRLKHESKTTIVALMRGGEPLAFGINDAFPLAMFVHAKEPEDLKLPHLLDQETIILVDSVVNNGTPIRNFVRHVRSIRGTIRIVVVASVVQRESIDRGGMLYDLAARGSFTIVTLRISENKFTGKGTTDTGNRLFNTTNLD